MAIAIELSSISDELKSEIRKRCLVKPNRTQYCDDPEPVVCFAVNIPQDTVYLPLGVWKMVLDDFPKIAYPRTRFTTSKELYTLTTDPKGYRDQDVVCEMALQRLSTEHVCFIAAACGFGKTTIGAHLAGRLRLKTAVLCHLNKVNEQWVQEFTTFSTAKVQRVKGTTLDPTADVYVMGVRKALSLSRKELSSIGFLIFDEAHIATITAFSRSLLLFQPRYVLGLSATPRRADGMQKLLRMYFGPPKEFIVREEIKDFFVYKVETPFRPDIRYSIFKGRSVIDWCHVVNSIAFNPERHALIVDLALKHPDHFPMILSARTKECRALYDLFVERGVDRSTITLLTGESKSRIEAEGVPKIVIAGQKLAGVGFDDPTRTMLILASDTKYVEQFEGRIRTVNNVIYDLVDDFSSFETHWSKYRLPWFVKRGAEIATIQMRPHTTGPRTTEPMMPTRRYLKSC